MFQKKLEKLIGKKSITTTIYRVQAYDSIMCGHLCIGFNDFILKDKNLLEYTSLFFPNEFKKNDKITFTYFQ